MAGPSPVSGSNAVDAFEALVDAFHGKALDIKVVMQQGRPAVRDVVKLLGQAENNPRLYNYFGLYKDAWGALLRIMKEGKGTSGEIGPALKAFGHYVRNHVTAPSARHEIRRLITEEATKHFIKTGPAQRARVSSDALKLHRQFQLLWRAAVDGICSGGCDLYPPSEALRRIDKAAAERQALEGARLIASRTNPETVKRVAVGTGASGGTAVTALRAKTAMQIAKTAVKNPGATVRGLSSAVRATRTVAMVAKHPVAAAVLGGTIAAGVAHLTGWDSSENPIIRAASANIFGHLHHLGVWSMRESSVGKFIRGLFS